jgi:hypothetical protein
VIYINGQGGVAVRGDLPITNCGADAWGDPSSLQLALGSSDRWVCSSSGGGRERHKFSAEWTPFSQHPGRSDIYTPTLWKFLYPRTDSV